ncbi:hypothetical protein [Psychrobacter pygoscelis]|uniref:hypothetical protein n=1 Tax=Psychrobacter pygoscelis TaxID=2488563 RepID=UPI00103F4328|nr:hypothetical protein [Psychrobacter pygoscelis]
MTQVIGKVKVENYSCSKPWVSCGGRDVELKIDINDSEHLGINVECGWDNYRAEVEIKDITATCFDGDDNELATEDIDLESLVDDIFSKYDTYEQVERAMIAAYHSDYA